MISVGTAIKGFFEVAMAFARGWISSRKPSRLSSCRLCLIKAKLNESPSFCQRLTSGYALDLKAWSKSGACCISSRLARHTGTRMV
jgi:hypothetical protein